MCYIFSIYHAQNKYTISKGRYGTYLGKIGPKPHISTIYQILILPHCVKHIGFSVPQSIHNRPGNCTHVIPPGIHVSSLLEQIYDAAAVFLVRTHHQMTPLQPYGISATPQASTSQFDLVQFCGFLQRISPYCTLFGLLISIYY